MTKIAFDIGGVLSKYPQLLRPIVSALLKSPGIEVHVISDMHSVDKMREVLYRNAFYIHPDKIHSANYAEEGEECKANLCTKLGIDILMDDFPGYLADGHHLRLLVMPDTSQDYYHPDWTADGSEGNFGRRRQR